MTEKVNIARNDRNYFTLTLILPLKGEENKEKDRFPLSRE